MAMRPRKGNLAIVGGLIVFIGAVSSYPVWYASRGTKVSYSDLLVIIISSSLSATRTILQIRGDV